MKGNIVAKHMHKSVRASVVASKRRLLQSEATLRDAREDALNELECIQTITFESGSEVHWDESEDCCESVLNSVNCSSVSIDDFEED